MRYTAFDTFVCRVQGWFSLRVSEEWDWIKQFEKAETDEMKNRWRIRIGVSEDEDMYRDELRLPKTWVFYIRKSRSRKPKYDWTCRPKMTGAEQRNLDLFDWKTRKQNAHCIATS